MIRGHLGRCTFRARCISVTKELMEDNIDDKSSDRGVEEVTTPAKPSSDCSSRDPSLKVDPFLAAMIGSYMTRVRYVTLLLLIRWQFLLIHSFLFKVEMLGFHHEKTLSLREVMKSINFLHYSSHFIAPFHAATKN